MAPIRWFLDLDIGRSPCSVAGLAFLIRDHPCWSAVTFFLSPDLGDSRGPLIGPFLPGWGGIPAIAALCAAPPPPPHSSQGIPDWRRFVPSTTRFLCVLCVLCGKWFCPRYVPLCSPLLASFSHRPHPPGCFVESKGQTTIRPSGDRAVESLFLCFSAV